MYSISLSLSLTSVFLDPITQVQIAKGQKLVILSLSSNKRGHLLVEYKDINLEIPFQLFEQLSVQTNVGLSI